MIDTHTHLYSTEFDEDRISAIQNAIENEFLAVMVEKFGPTDLEKQLELIPSELKTVYTRIFFEIRKELQDA